MKTINKHTYTWISSLGLSVFMFLSCERMEIRTPLEDDGIAPGVVTDLTVENFSGGATISYELPKDEDLLYVEAHYEIREGVKQKVRSSHYNHELTVRGFGDTQAYPVALYTVDRGGNRSEPVSVTVNPLISPVQLAFETLSYQRDFGGISMAFENEAQADLSATVLIKDSFGEWVEYDKYYTGLPVGIYPVRGLPAEPTTFGIYISDHWDNTSDTLVQEEIPLFEMMLTKNYFRHLPLPGEALNRWNYNALWDNVTTNNSGYRSNGQFPMHFSIDLGVTAKLSRMRFWGVYDGREYSSSNLREFDLWGSNEPNPDGSFDGWTLIGEYEVVRPSGLSVGDDLTEDDRQVAADGFEFLIPLETPNFRYLRFNLQSSFAVPRNAANGEIWIREISFWGQEVE